MNPCLIIGLGKVGSSLLRLLKEEIGVTASVWEPFKAYEASWKPYLSASDFFKELDTAVIEKAQIVFICTNDDAIATVARELAQFNLNGKTVAHTSGALTAEILTSLKKQGAAIGSFHPLQSFNKMFLAPQTWHNIFCSFEGEDSAFENIKKLFAQAPLNVLRVDQKQKRALHLTAAIAANFQAGLYAWAGEILSSAGFSLEQTGQLLGPLAKQVANNFTREPLPRVLTGPLQRGDRQTIQTHLKYLQDYHSHFDQRLYRLLSLKILESPIFNLEHANGLKEILTNHED